MRGKRARRMWTVETAIASSPFELIYFIFSLTTTHDFHLRSYLGLLPSSPRSRLASMDTDLLLTLLRSLLHPTLYSDEALLQALLDSDGSVEAAAEKLLLGGVGGPSSSSLSNGKKKKRQGTLQSWVEGGKKETFSSTPSSSSKKLKPNPPSPSSSSPSPTSPSAPSTSKPKKPQNLLALAALRPPPPTAPSPSSTSLPPLLLPSARLLAQHLSCIVVPPSPVPSSLANALYLVMMKESETWEKVTWVINGLEVKSPHTVRPLLSSLSPTRPLPSLSTHPSFLLLPVFLLRFIRLKPLHRFSAPGGSPLL